MNAMTSAIIQEIKTESDFLPEKPLESVYFGGGTPSMLPAESIDEIIQQARQIREVSEKAEITLEANPEDITIEKLKAWKEAGINRLSIGVQSLSETDLKYMNRNHNAEKAREAVDLSLRSGFPSVNVDLIFGSPWLSDDEWEKSMFWAFHSGADHISAYALTIEPKTAYNLKVQKGLLPPTDEQRQAKQYQMLMEMADSCGWDFYEISNLSKPGQRAVHNSNYWKNLPYLGVGPSAHSYNGEIRRWNPSNNTHYLQMAEKREWIRESEVLSENDKINEYILTNIRTVEGIDMNFLKLFPFFNQESFIRTLVPYDLNGFIILDKNKITLTSSGRLIADQITRDLMLE